MLEGEARTEGERTGNDDEWRRLWAHRHTKEVPPSWWRNKRLRGISLDGTSFLAIDETTNRLHWNGEELQTRQAIRLEGATLAVAVVASASAFGLFVIELGRALTWWS